MAAGEGGGAKAHSVYIWLIKLIIQYLKWLRK